MPSKKNAEQIFLANLTEHWFYCKYEYRHILGGKDNFHGRITDIWR